MILGWIGAIESLVVVILTTIGLTHVPQIMDHLRNETRMGAFKMEAINETHVSIFRRNRGEMTAEDEMFIERGKANKIFISLSVTYRQIVPTFCYILRITHYYPCIYFMLQACTLFWY